MRRIIHKLNRRLSQSIHQTVLVPYSRASVIPSESAFLCTQSQPRSDALVNETLVSKEEDQEEKEEDFEPCLTHRIVRLAKEEPILWAFQSWMGDGFPVQTCDVFDTIDHLRKHNMNTRALEFMEWVIKERPYKIRDLDYAYLLEFTIKVHGLKEGEKLLFLRVPSEFQNGLLYSNLVIGCLDQNNISLSFEYMKKMREYEYPISHLVYNRLIICSEREDIPEILCLMKADKVPRHVSTYNILMEIEASEHSIDKLVRLFGEMKVIGVEPDVTSYCIMAKAHVVARLYSVAETYVEIIEKCYSENDWETFDVLISLYGSMGKTRELERIWNSVKELPDIPSKTYIAAIVALGKIGEVDRAELLFHDMMSKTEAKTTEQFNSILFMYCRLGLVKKACEVYRDIVENDCEPDLITYGHLTLGCLKAGLVKEAIKTLDKQLDMGTPKGVWPDQWLELLLSIVDTFAEIGDLGSANKIFEFIRQSTYVKYTFVYNTMINAYVNAKVYDPQLLERMILDGARPDSETYSLVKLTEQYRSK